MLLRKDRIELSHLTYENHEKFGITNSQLVFINELLYKVSDKIHGYVLDKLYNEGAQHVQYRLTSIEAEKLIDSLINDKVFEFVEWNTPEWHNLKVMEKREKLIYLK